MNLPKKNISKGKVVGILAVGLIVFTLACVIAISIYNTPANRLARQLDLGNRYLKEQNYEMAAVAFARAIAIDNRCLQAHEGQIKAYISANDIENLTAAYQNALSVVENAEEDDISQHTEACVSIYLAAEEVYDGNTDRIIEILEKGAEKTGDARVIEKLENNQKKAEEENLKKILKAAQEYSEAGEYEKALAEYDKVPESAGKDDDFQAGLGDCLREYMEELIEEDQLEAVKDIVDKYETKADNVDFQEVVDRVEEKEIQEQGTWVDDLYAKMIAGDYEAVYAIMEASDFLDKCNEFAHEEVVWSMDYCLTTSDGKVIAVIKSLNDDTVTVAYCVHKEHYSNEIDGVAYPNDIFEGDYCYEIIDGKKTCLINDQYLDLDVSTEKLDVPSGAIWEVFHMM